MLRVSLVLGAVAVAACGPATAPPVRPGIEVLLADSMHVVRGARIGLLTNHTGVDRAGHRDVDRLRAAGLRVTTLFSPEHGFRGTEDRPGLADAVDSVTGLPIYSLYTGSRPPTFAAVDSLDVLLIDLQDVGARYYTYVSSAVQLMREAARRGRRVVVLDRPNPIGGVLVQGQVRAEPAPLEIFVGILPVAMRHGMTLGELLRLANDAYDVGATLVVIPAVNWRRAMPFTETGLPWVRPSPNLPDLESALHYPGTCLFEGTNLSVGRGTPFAFQVVGAPWLDAVALVARLRDALGAEGVALTPVEFTPLAPTDGKYPDVSLRGVRLRVTDHSAYDPTRTAVALLAAVYAAAPDSLRFAEAAFDRLAAGPDLRRAVLAGHRPEAIWSAWGPGLERFLRLRAKYLLY